ncbi:hypothetical protein IWQ60_004908 [Tieghemiomyces parasiticus]|uniref:Peptide hydrolase n=1 Tax=Tieghemiomyces parasiticus TaxID=78921 RepID=A0A9W8A7Y5_9FUNG|nr:hypothetical protein IWQ60_004908 [Tieghemiomyces parasiticus]
MEGPAPPPYTPKAPQGHRYPSQHRQMVKKVAVGFSVVALLAVTALYPSEYSGIAPVSSPTPPRPSLFTAHDDMLDQQHIRQHLESLYAIAGNNSNSRAVALGHRESADYVYNVLESHGACDTLETQWFDTPVYTEKRPPRLSMSYPTWIAFRPGLDFQGMRYGGNSSTYLPSRNVYPVNGGGCRSYQYGPSTKGNVAVIQITKLCSLFEAAYTAQRAGVAAVLFYGSPNQRTLPNGRVRQTEWQVGDPSVSIPVLAVSYPIGRMLAGITDARINLVVANEIAVVPTYNVLCAWEAPLVNDTIVVGSHLAGPGINDNGSGSASTLEIILALRRSKFRPAHRLVFAWWSAEEDGLLGSQYFARTLYDATASTNATAITTDAYTVASPLKMALTWPQIYLYLNFDMLASPNYIAMIHRGEDAPGDLTIGSTLIQQAFESFFRQRQYPYALTRMTAGSDFVPFLQRGVPAGGILTGAGEIKTPDQRARFGGLANTPLDPCYHQACDTLDNVNWEALYRMSEAAAHVVRYAAGENDGKGGTGVEI